MRLSAVLWLQVTGKDNLRVNRNKNIAVPIVDAFNPNGAVVFGIVSPGQSLTGRQCSKQSRCIYLPPWLFSS